MLSLQGLPQTASAMAHGYIAQSKDQVALKRHLFDLARATLCQHAPDFNACGQCHSCELFSAQSHPDFVLINEDQGNIGVDEIRLISEFTLKTPQISQAQVVIIQAAENMTENAANALLKTLEEPSQNRYLFLMTSDKASLLPTIISRCQVLSLPVADRAALKAKYPDIPEFILSYSQGAESKLIGWLEEGSIEKFSELYQSFLQWLKGQTPSFQLAQQAAENSEMTDLLIFLLGKRQRQKLLMVESQGLAQQASGHINKYLVTRQQVPAQNTELALDVLLQQLNGLI